jgi:hypothetical protein
MTQKLSCHHGHRFKAPLQPGVHAVCPLCGAVTRFRQADVDTKGRGALDPTLNQPNSGTLETLEGGNHGKTLDVDSTSSPSQAVGRTNSSDKPQGGDATNSDTYHEMVGGRTVALDRTLNLDGPAPIADDATSKDAVQADPSKESTSQR